MTTPLLALDAVSKSYGALKVTDNLSFSLAESEALGVLGPNGAGKSTMFNLITGDVRPDRGRVLHRGEDITHLPASARCRRGIGRSYQVPHPFAGMTVLENVVAGGVFGGGMGENEAEAHAVAVLERTGLIGKANQLAGSLTLLDRKRLELARALGTRPRLLLLDEIAGGLTDHEAHALVDTIRAIRAEGVSIIWIEHVVHALLSVVDRLIVINFGALLKAGAPREVMASREVREVYMGIEAEAEVA
ncbi:MAG TPA: ABC transporter ATP-binding protein [Burkholderiaceae bacterium]|nr:ABC transporter ATP-binding protein [Burkholderiaceae bacterium]